MFGKISARRAKVFLLPLLFLLLTFCITISTVTQPTTATVGETINITVDVDIAPIEDASYNVVFGVLAPESWDVANNAVATYTSDNGNGNLVLAPDNTFEAQMNDVVGIGENYGAVEWVSFVSDGLVSGVNGVNFTGQVQLTLTVGDENIRTQLGYVVGDNVHGIALDDNGAPFFGSRFTECMEVTGGENPLIDLCGPLPFPVSTQPAEYTLNDVIKITFDGTKGPQGTPTELFGAESVYLCGTVTADGTEKEICMPNANSMLTNVGQDLWEISIWPKQFFDLPLEADVSAISYSFTNEAGDITVQNPDTGEDFQLISTCATSN